MMTNEKERKGVNPRELALDILLEIVERDGLSHVVLSQALSKYQYLEKQDRAFITRVTEGTLEYLIQIDYVLGRYSSVKVEKMKPVIRALLRMSVYQILYMDRIPDSAVCNEAVKLAAKRRFQGLKGFVNGVLRTVSRNKEQLTFPDDRIRYSIPQWIYDMWMEEYPKETVRKVLEAFLDKSRLCVRLCAGRAEAEAIKDSLIRQGVLVEDSGYGDDLVFLDHVDYVESLEAFQKGWIQIQDLSSAMVVRAANPQKGWRCIDVCGAPGGESLHLAEVLGGTGQVEVRDISHSKADLIEDSVKRLGYSNVTVTVMDALLKDEKSVEAADLVLADLPCSGLGVMGRKPDIKLRATPQSARDLAQLQRDILSVVWQYVKPGGVLVYSTCTINRKENQDNAAWFSDNFPFEPVDIRGRLGDGIREETMEQGYVQLLPGIYPCDGFFLAVFRRVEERAEDRVKGI